MALRLSYGVAGSACRRVASCQSACPRLTRPFALRGKTRVPDFPAPPPIRSPVPGPVTQWRVGCEGDRGRDDPAEGCPYRAGDQVGRAPTVGELLGRRKKRGGVALRQDQTIVGGMLWVAGPESDVALQDRCHHMGHRQTRRRMARSGSGSGADAVGGELAGQTVDICCADQSGPPPNGSWGCSRPRLATPAVLRTRRLLTAKRAGEKVEVECLSCWVVRR